MEIINQLYGNSALIIPHRPYNLLTGEFREKDHTRYLGNLDETWDPLAAFNEAKFLHFSDFPVPKPWLSIENETLKEHQPSCGEEENGEEGCVARDMWNGFYTDFKERRKVRLSFTIGWEFDYRSADRLLPYLREFARWERRNRGGYGFRGILSANPDEVRDGGN